MRKNYLFFLSLIMLFSVTFSACSNKKDADTKTSEPKKVEQVKETPPPAPEKVKAPVEQKVEPVAVERKIVVKEGEWLYEISRKAYGNIYGWRKIYEANKAKIQNPDLIYPNQELVIPD